MPLWTRVQSKSLAQDAASTTIALAFDSNVTAGNFIVVYGFCDSGGTVASIADTIGNSYAQDVSHANADPYEPSVWSAQSPNGGANTVTITFSASKAFRRIVIIEYQDILAANPTDVTAGADGVSTTPASGAAGTTVDGDLCLGFCVDVSGSPVTYTAGTNIAWTKFEDTASSVAPVAAEEGEKASAGSVNADWTLSASHSWVALLVTYKPVPLGEGPIYRQNRSSVPPHVRLG
jgi:hypothetical protein